MSLDSYKCAAPGCDKEAVFLESGKDGVMRGYCAEHWSGM